MPTSRDELPGTLKRSPKKAQETWLKTHDSAVESYGEGERAHRTAFASLKHSFEKVEDHWEPKKQKGPSDPQAVMARAAVSRTAMRRSVTFNMDSKWKERARALYITSGRPASA